MNYINYIKYVIRHKWFVFLAGLEWRVSLWQLLIHDWHKFLPSEFGPYVNTFYKKDGSKQYVESPEFTYAWRLHQIRGKHHWQHWLITWDRGVTEAIEMPDKYVREMIADWFGAGKAITGEWGAREWYEKNKDKIILHPKTRSSVEFYFQSSVFRPRLIDCGMTKTVY